MPNSFEHDLLVFSFAVQDWFSLAQSAGRSTRLHLISSQMYEKMTNCWLLSLSALSLLLSSINKTSPCTC